MFDWLKKKSPSRDNANERLRLVLMHDRIGTSSQFMESLKGEIIEVISRHVEIEGTPVITLSSEGRRSVLDINISLKGR